jgi:uncharacterized membrane protein
MVIQNPKGSQKSEGVAMSNAQQALAMTVVLFGLSFVGIFLFWFAEKFRPHGRPKLPR